MTTPTTPHTITLHIPSVMPTPPEGYRILEYTIITRWPLIQREPMCDESGAMAPTSGSAVAVAEDYLNECLALEVVAVNDQGDEIIAECPLGRHGTWSEWD